MSSINYGYNRQNPHKKQIYAKLVCKIILEGLGTRGMSQLTERLCLDLSDTLSCDLELLSNLLEGSGSAVLKTKAKLYNLLFSGGQGVQDIAKLLSQKRIGSTIGGCGRIVILNEIAKVAVLFLTDGGFKGNGVLRDLHDLSDLISSHAESFCDLIGVRLSSKLLKELTGGS